MKTIKWYLHGGDGDIPEWLKEKGAIGSPKALLELASQIHDAFYEVGFKVDYDELTGKIIKVTMEDHGASA